MTNTSLPVVSLPPRDLVARGMDAIAHPTDRLVLSGLFTSLFLLHFAAGFIHPPAGEGMFSALRTAELIGFAAIARVISRLGADRVLRWLDLLAIAGAAIALIHPWPRLGAFVLTGLGLLFVARKDRRLSSLGQLCLGFAWIDLWGIAALALLDPWILPLETALGYFAASLFGTFSLLGNTILSESGHGIVVYAGCSAFSNTIKATFIWLSLVKLQGSEFKPRHFRSLAVSLISIVLLNSARLALMVSSAGDFEYWHGGPGADLISGAMLAIVLGSFCIELPKGRGA